MSREVVFLHTIEQWLAYPPPLRATILQSIKLKDRLNRYLLANSNREPLPPEGKWDACKKCSTKGWVLKKPRLPGLHPSQIPNPCLLKIYWEMKGKPEQSKHKPDSLLTFDIGHAVHDMLQGYGRGGAWGPMYEAEVTLSPQKQPIAAELMIQGSADAENILVIDDIPNAPIYEVGLVHEYKTIKKENYDKLIRPKPEHKQQATIYGGVLNRPVVVYLYICKNDSRVSDYPVEFDPDMWSKVHAKATLLVGYFNRGEEPAAEPGYGCTQCPYAYKIEDGGCQAHHDLRNRVRRAP
jgi:hypothetical protein